MDRKIQQGEGGPRSGTKKRCSHNLHDLVSGYLQSSFSQRKYFRSEKRTGRENNSIIEKTLPCLFVSLVCRICPFVLNLQNASDSHCNRVNSQQ